MKLLLTFLFSLSLVVIYSQDEVSGVVFSGGMYTMRKTPKGEAFNPNKDTIKSDFKFIVNTTGKFIFLQTLDGMTKEKIPFKELKVKDMTSESTKSLGFIQKNLFTMFFPYVEPSEELKPTFLSWDYNSLTDQIIVKVSTSSSKESVSYDLYIDQTQYLNWEKEIVFQRVYKIDQYQPELKGEVGKVVPDKGQIILSDTAVTVKTNKIQNSFTYNYIYKGDSGQAYMSRRMIFAFPKKFSIKDKWFTIMMDQNKDTKKWETIHMLRQVK